MLDSKRRECIRKTKKHLSRLIIIILALGAIKLGTYVGDRLSETDNTLVKKVDTENYKKVLNNYFPLIDFVYNSGNINVSIAGEINNLVRNIFGFELKRPETVLNANMIMLSDYYPTYEDEQQKAAKNAVEEKNTPIPSPLPESTPDNTAQNATKVETNDASTGVHTETETGEKKEATPVPVIEEKDTSSFGKVSVLQLEGTKYKIDIEGLLKDKLNLKTSKSGPKVLIYHTHTTEAYLKNTSEMGKNVPSRMDDPKYTVMTVGDELTKYLKQAGIGVIHNGTNHLAQGDIGAYARSLDTITNIINGNPSIAMTFDIHRDGLGETQKLRSVANIKGKNAAKIMFVVGTNYNLAHPNWKENLKLALKLQKYLEDNCPGITRPTYISANRYNEHVANGSLIVEVGGDGNTIDEASESMKYLAKAIVEVTK